MVNVKVIILNSRFFDRRLKFFEKVEIDLYQEHPNGQMSSNL